MRKGMTYSDAGKLGALASIEKAKARHQEFVDKYNATPKTCKNCGIVIPFEKRRNIFCSQKCAAISSNRSIAERKILSNVSKTCIVCGSKIRARGKFCSNKCQKKFQWIQRVRKVDETGYFDTGNGVTTTGEVSRYFARRYLTEKNGYKCSICGLSEWMKKPITLIVDHIDGNPLNNKVDNFRLVCPNCDSQLPTYKANNKGHGRKWRKNYL